MPERPVKTVHNVLDLPALEVLAKSVGIVRDEARQYTDEASQRYAAYAEGVAAALQWMTGVPTGALDDGSRLYALLAEAETQARYSADPAIVHLQRDLGRC